MTPTQIKTFQKLLEDPSFKGKKQLKYLLWLNTSEPRFKIGDCFKITDHGRTIYGYPVRDFKAMITEVKTYGMNVPEYQYTLQMEIKCGAKEYVATSYIPEKVLGTFQKCKGNKNTLQDPRSDHSDEIDVPL